MLCLGFLLPGSPVPGLENLLVDALSRPSSVPSPSASALVSPSRVALVQDLGLTPFEEFLPGSAPSLLSSAPSLSSSDAPVISGIDISLSYLHCSSPTRPSPRWVLPLPSPWFQILLKPVYFSVTLQQVLYALLFLFSSNVSVIQLFNLLHDIAHPGVSDSRRLVSSKFV